ncbi:hypothetical protein DM01DRAFT_1332673 [Hesseltinella vesiculosa]|uniref:Uncharacterized protein n=1 Tax=Hesseltinella vesiculosa TaxID=101127 RepID=A0A1X2GSU7_9FUNG|nr:hypothetical protein DM01DRAFT_1332673 [Hesseltinella vesiculosa]
MPGHFFADDSFYQHIKALVDIPKVAEHHESNSPLSHPKIHLDDDQQKVPLDQCTLPLPHARHFGLAVRQSPIHM